MADNRTKLVEKDWYLLKVTGDDEEGPYTLAFVYIGDVDGKSTFRLHPEDVGAEDTPTISLGTNDGLTVELVGHLTVDKA